MEELRRLFRLRKEEGRAPAPRSPSPVLFDQTNGLTSFDGPARPAPEPPMSDAERLHRAWAIENELHRDFP